MEDNKQNKVTLLPSFLELSSSEQLVMIRLLLTQQDGICRLNERQLARDTGLTHRQIRTIRKRLEDKEYIQKSDEGNRYCYRVATGRNLPYSISGYKGFSRAITNNIVKIGTWEINIEKFVAFWNEQMKDCSIPQLQHMSERRVSMLKARVRIHGKDSLYTVVLKCSRSNFLNGENSKSWIATYDWMFKPDNYIKILEGNYDNKEKAMTDGEKRIISAAELADRLLHS